MATYDWEMRAGQTYPPLNGAIVNEFNSAVNIAGQKGIKMYMWLVSTNATSMISGRSASVTDSANGYFVYRWTAGDTSAFSGKPGKAYINVTMSDNSNMRVPTQGWFDVYVASAPGT